MHFLKERFAILEKKWLSVCKLYGEEPEIQDPSVFFTSITEFVDLYKVTLMIFQIIYS